jgi:hypothetical protein
VDIPPGAIVAAFLGGLVFLGPGLLEPYIFVTTSQGRANFPVSNIDFGSEGPAVLR